MTCIARFKPFHCVVLFLLAAANLSAAVDTWRPHGPGGDGRSFNKIWFANATTGWTVGNDGLISRTTDGGATWVIQASGTTGGLNNVWGIDANNVWAVGNGGLVLKWNGSAWSAQTSGTTQNLSAVWGSDASNVWAAGSFGTIVKWNGSAWSAQTSGTTEGIASIWGLSASNIWAVGASGVILKWNGSGWSAQTSGTSYPLQGVWGVDANNVWAVGYIGTILKWNGSAWSTQTSPFTNAFIGVWGSDANNIWAVATAGRIAKWNGSAWSDQASGTTQWFSGVWGSDSSNVWAVGAGGTMQKWNGSSWSAQAAATTTEILSGMWGSDESSIWAVGSSGIIMKWNGTAWSKQTSGTTQGLNGVWGSSASNAWAVGSGGTILRWNGSAWSAQTSGTTQGLNSVWGLDASNVWAVGNSGTILKWNGSTWTTQTSDSTQTLYGVWGLDASNVWAVGNGGTILKWDGSAWSAQASGTTQAFRSVWGSDANNIWAVGVGAMQKWDGSAWSAQSYGASEVLYSVWGSDASNVWTVSQSGMILKWNGSAWSTSVSNTSTQRRAVWGTSDTHVLSSGATGFIITNATDTPEIAVEQPMGTNVSSGGSKAFGAVTVGSSADLDFTLKNSSTAALNLTGSPDKVALSGPDAAQFSVIAQPASPVNPTSSTTFTVRFAPTSLGTKTATLTISNSDSNEGTFTIGVSGIGNTLPVLSLPSSPVIAEATGPSGAAVSFVVSASDAEDDPDPIPTANPPSGSTFPLGDTAVNVSATDSAGASVSGSFIVRVRDTTGPVVTVPANISVSTTSLSGTVVNFSTSASDTVDGARTTTADHASGSVFLIGTTVVNVTATDSRGNAGSASFSVTVTGVPEVAVEQPSSTDLPSGGSRAFGTVTVGSHADLIIAVKNIGAADLNLTGTPKVDVSGGAGQFSVIAEPVSPVSASSAASFTVRFAPASSGAQSATLTIVNNDSDEGTFTIAVSGTGNDAPVPSLPSSPVIVEAASASGAVANFSVTASDSEDGSLVPTVNPASGSIFPLGDTTVDVSATDSAGASKSGSFIVRVRDSIAPVVSAHANVGPIQATSVAGAVVTYAAADATDAVGVASITYSQDSGTTFPIGTTTVTITAKDAANNAGTGTFTVTVTSAEIAVEQPLGAALEDGSTTIAFGDVIVGTSSTAKTFRVSNNGTANLTLSAVSVSGGNAADFVVNAAGLPPTLSPGVSANFTVVFSPGATSSRTTTLQVSSSDLGQGTFDITLIGTGVPNTAPTVTLAGASPLVIEAAATYTDPGASATDVEDGTLSPIITSNSVAPNVPGTYAVTWSATDTLGLSGSTSRTVNVVDTTAPVITPPANIIVNPTVTAPPAAAGTNVTFAATATDVVGVTSLTYSPASGSLFAMGTTTTVTVTAKDAANNTSTATFTVKVRPKDNTPPILTITSPATGVAIVPSPLTLTGTVKDDVEIASLVVKLNGTELPLDSPIVSTPNTNIPFQISGVQLRNGTSSIEFKLTDASGRSVTITRTVTYQNSRPELAGTYDAILMSAGMPDSSNTGMVTATLSSLGAVSGKITIGNTAIIFPTGGLLTNDGEARFSAAQTPSLELKNASNVVLGYLTFTMDETTGLTGQVTDPSGSTILASFSGLKAPYSSTDRVPDQYLTHPAGGPFTQGLYTVVFGSKEQTPVMDHALYPQGDGIGQMSLSYTGGISISVRLPDGTIIGASGKLREDGTAVCYNQLYSNQGGLGLQFSFADLADSDVTTTHCLWIRPAQPGSSQYVSGWPNGVRMDGVGTKLPPVSNPNFGQGADDVVNGNTSLVFSEGLLSAPLSYAVSIHPASGVITQTPVSADYLLNYTANNGMIAGNFLHTDGATVNYVGIMLNKGGNRGGFGFFLSSGANGQSGGMSLDPGGP